MTQEQQKTIFDEISERLRDGFGIDDLEWAARRLVRGVLDAIPGATGREKLQWVKDRLVELVESLDHLIPVIGAWLDNPLADAAERQGIEAIVDWALTPVIEWAYAVEKINNNGVVPALIG